MQTIEPLTFPARPINGGALDLALPKRGQWFYEPKYNGWRALIHVPTGEAFNRRGQPLSIANECRTAIQVLQALLIEWHCSKSLEWIDGELLCRRHDKSKGALIVLDAPALPHGMTYSQRRKQLEALFIINPSEGPVPDNLVVLAPNLQLQHDMALKWYAMLKKRNALWGCEYYEGVVAKRADSLYPLQLNSADQTFSGWIKHRWNW